MNSPQGNDDGRPTAVAEPAASAVPITVEIDKALQGVVEKPHQREQATRAVLRVVTQMISHSGPLPPPEQLEGYSQVLPNAPERIVTMAEKEQSHRHLWERRALLFEFLSSILGSALGFLVSLGLMGCALYSATIGQPWLGAGFLTAAAFGMVTAFIRGRRPAEPEKPQKPPTSQKQKKRR